MTAKPWPPPPAIPSASIVSPSGKIRWIRDACPRLSPACLRRIPVGANGWRRSACTRCCREAGVPRRAPWRVAKSSTGQVVWVAATADDFDTEQRPDLIFTKVKTARLEKIILANLGVDTASMPLWSSCLGPAGKPLPEFPLYMDKRQPRDDPYAYMRW